MPLHIDPKGLKVDLGINPGGDVQSFFVDACYRHMDKYVPRRPGTIGGSLRETVTLNTESITYEMPYARYQYYGEREDGSHKVKHYSTPGTGPYWDERMQSAELQDLIDEVQAYIDSGGK